MDVPSWTCNCMLRECQVTFKISVRFSFQRFYLFQTACMFDCLFKISFVFSKANKPLHTIQIDSFLNTYLCTYLKKMIEWCSFWRKEEDHAKCAKHKQKVLRHTILLVLIICHFYVLKRAIVKTVLCSHWNKLLTGS